MKLRFAVTASAVFAVAVAASAAEVSEIDILKPALTAARHVVMTHNVAPAILSLESRGGAEHFAKEWIQDHETKLVAQDIVDSYTNANQSRIDVSAAAPAGMKIEDLRGFESGNTYDWKKFSEAYPNARAIVVVSRPAVDSLGTTALVRYDIITATDSWTSFQKLEKQSIDGSWKPTSGALGKLSAFYRPDVYLHPPSGR